MFGRVSDTDIFTIDKPARDSALSPSPDQFSPYADAWKEFDKLQKLVTKGGLPRLFDILFGVALAYQPLALKGHKSTLAIIYLLAALAGGLYLRRAKNRFQHWPCPRCHSEWPGDKTEKDRACRMCGLRLHQMQP